ncbi:hypothetical protein GCM10010428_63620 [Actinosynnema pretiosum subsp. pretiosum]
MEDGLARERVEVGQGLVEQQQAGALAQRQREGDAGALAAGEGADLGPEGDVRPPDQVLGVALVPGGVGPRPEAERLGHGELLVERLLLGEVGHRGVQAPARGLVAEDGDGPGGRPQQAGDQPHEGALARPVRADEGHDPVRRDHQRGRMQGPAPAVLLAHAFGDDRERLVGLFSGGHGCLLPPLILGEVTPFTS